LSPVLAGLSDFNQPTTEEQKNILQQFALGFSKHDEIENVYYLIIQHLFKAEIISQEAILDWGN
jgi:hypothetical protein